MVISSLAASCCCCAENPLIPAVQFSRAASTDEELQKLTAAIIGLANSLGINVLAEGVETQ
jgi:hypothetical protein